MADTPTARHYVLEMPGQPLGPNERRRAHWSMQARDTATFRDGFALLAKQAHQGAPLEHARVEVVLIRKHGQAPLDVDNSVGRAKGPIDGLVAGGMLCDDSAGHITLVVRQEQGRQRATRVEVTEIA